MRGTSRDLRDICKGETNQQICGPQFKKSSQVSEFKMLRGYCKLHAPWAEADLEDWQFP